MSRATDAPIGVLLVNVGTPASPTTRDVRRFLREFLSDERVVDTNRVVWWFVLNAIILPFRAPSSAALYRSIWTAEGSPILQHSKYQARAVAERLGPGFAVVLAMRCGDPGIDAAVVELQRAGCQRVLLVPLFPQYSRTTTGSIIARVEEVLASRAPALELTVVRSFEADPGYVEALAQRVREASANRDVEHTVFSFHGIPLAYVQRGDPYPEQCRTTARLLADALAFDDDRWSLVFQSRFGSKPWLEPYTDRFVPALAARYRRVAITMPGFVADCLETLEEIGERLQTSFRAAGGEELVVVPALNDHPAWIDALVALCRAEAPAADA